MFDTSPEIAARLEQLHVERAKLTESLLAVNTRQGYKYDWKHFEKWCFDMELRALPAEEETVSLYATSMLSDGKKTSTATRRVAAVAYMHRALSLKSPVTREVRQLIHGAKRMRTEQVRRMRPLQLADVRAIAISLAAEGTPIAIRNRAIILTGFVSALRSANLAALHVNDVEFCEPGCLLRINREKNDQEGRGRMIGLPKGSAIETCPVGALADWMERRGGFPGPLFTRFASTGALQALPLVPERIGLVVKQCAQRIGLDPQFYSGHSLRSGFVTTAGEGGATDLLIAHQTGHRDMNVLRRYFRKQDCFRGAVSMLGV